MNFINYFFVFVAGHFQTKISLPFKYLTHKHNESTEEKMKHHSKNKVRKYKKLTSKVKIVINDFIAVLH